jgi:hypothetical protein
MAGVKLIPVHYRGGAPAISDLVGDHIPMLFISFPSVREHVKAGRIKMLGRRRQQTPRVAAGRSDHRRNRSGLRSLLLVRPVCAGGDAEGYCCEDQRRRAACVRRRGIPAELPRSVRLRVDHLFAGGVYRLRHEGCGALGQGDQGCRCEDRIAPRCAAPSNTSRQRGGIPTLRVIRRALRRIRSCRRKRLTHVKSHTPHSGVMRIRCAQEFSREDDCNAKHLDGFRSRHVHFHVGGVCPSDSGGARLGGLLNSWPKRLVVT